MPIRFHIYYHSPENGDYLRQVVHAAGSGIVVGTDDLGHLPAVGGHEADVIVLEYQENNSELDHWIEQNTGNHHGPAIFLFFQEISTPNLWKALRLGVKECFTRPIQEKEFQEAVNRVMARAATWVGGEEAVQVVTFLGCKGGVGTTFLAANVAYLLARERKGQALLIDLDLHYSQLSYFFDIQPQYSIGNVVSNIDEVDAAYLQGLFHVYDKNLYLLLAPANLEEAETVTPEHLAKILRLAKTIPGLRRILIDAGQQLNEMTLKILEMSDELVLVVAPLIPALSNAKKLLGLLHLLGLESLSTEIWLNAWEKDGELTLDEVSKFLGKDISGTVQFDHGAVEHSINEGRPLMETAPRHAVSQDIRVLAARLLGLEQPEKADAGWGWLKIFGRRG